MLCIALSMAMYTTVSHGQSADWIPVVPGIQNEVFKIKPDGSVELENVYVSSYFGATMFPQTADDGSVAFISIANITSSTNTSVATLGDNVVLIEVDPDGTSVVEILLKRTDGLHDGQGAEAGTAGALRLKMQLKV